MTAIVDMGMNDKMRMHHLIKHCCDLIEHTCKSMHWTQLCVAEAMFSLNAFVRHEEETDRINVQTILDSPPQILAAAAILVRFRIHRNAHVLEQNTQELNRLIDYCFEHKLTKKQRATRAALDKATQMHKSIGNNFPTLVYEELQRMLHWSMFDPLTTNDDQRREQKYLHERVLHLCQMYANDTFRCNVCVRYNARDIACACLLLVLQQFNYTHQQCMVTEQAHVYFQKQFELNGNTLLRIVSDLRLYYEAVAPSL